MVFALAWVQIDYVHPTKDVVLKCIETDPPSLKLHLLFPLFVSLPLSGRKKIKKPRMASIGPGWNFEGSSKHHSKRTQASIK